MVVYKWCNLYFLHQSMDATFDHTKKKFYLMKKNLVLLIELSLKAFRLTNLVSSLAKTIIVLNTNKGEPEILKFKLGVRPVCILCF